MNNRNVSHADEKEIDKFVEYFAPNWISTDLPVVTHMASRAHALTPSNSYGGPSNKTFSHINLSI